MKINWFPGHMSKTLGQIGKILKVVDVVIYVLDGRAPVSCLNPKLSEISGNKPILYVINKTDLADEERLKALAPKFISSNSDYCLVDSTMSGAGKIVKNKLLALCKDKLEKYQNKGVKMTIRAVVVGVPNSGKSTLVNNLCGKAKTVTGDKPGVTKSLQWLSLGGCIEICDTPGTLYPNLTNQDVAKKLCFIGSIKDEVVEINELGAELIDVLKSKYSSLFDARYKGAASLEDVASCRGFVLGKGELDIERAARAVLDDFRKGRIGKITLD